jgi:hypothetical protein
MSDGPGKPDWSPPVPPPPARPQHRYPWQHLKLEEGEQPRTGRAQQLVYVAMILAGSALYMLWMLD